MIRSGHTERHVPLDFDDNFQDWVYDLEDYRFIDSSFGFNQERLVRAEGFILKLTNDDCNRISDDCCLKRKTQ